MKRAMTFLEKRHCEEIRRTDEAIQEPRAPNPLLLDCFASLAMTGLG